MIDRFYISTDTIVQFDNSFDESFILYQKINNVLIITLNSKSVFYSSIYNIYAFDIMTIRLNCRQFVFCKLQNEVSHEFHR